LRVLDIYNKRARGWSRFDSFCAVSYLRVVLVEEPDQTVFAVADMAVDVVAVVAVAVAVDIDGTVADIAAAAAVIGRSVAVAVPVKGGPFLLPPVSLRPVAVLVVLR
jgi:hypothetical protein